MLLCILYTTGLKKIEKHVIFVAGKGKNPYLPTYPILGGPYANITFLFFAFVIVSHLSDTFYLQCRYLALRWWSSYVIVSLSCFLSLHTQRISNQSNLAACFAETIILGFLFVLCSQKDELKWGLMGIPFWYFFVVFINVFSIFLGVPQGE